jgi:hypothetical protein
MGALLGHVFRCLHHVGRQRSLGRTPLEGRLSREHLVRERAQAVDVRAVVQVRLAHGLLGRHVGRGAQGDAHRGQLAGTGVAHRLGHAEVRDDGMAAREHHVVGLDVTVHDAAFVGVGQGVRNLAEDADRIAHRQHAVSLELLTQGLAFHERHDVEEESSRLAGIVQRQDVGMRQLRDDLDLAREAVGTHGRGELGPEDLQRDLPIVLEVVGEVDGCHASLPDLTLDGVGVGERRAHSIDGLGHPRKVSARVEKARGKSCPGVRRPAPHCRQRRFSAYPENP